jgi:hypothetical protein
MKTGLEEQAQKDGEDELHSFVAMNGGKPKEEKY